MMNVLLYLMTLVFLLVFTSETAVGLFLSSRLLESHPRSDQVRFLANPQELRDAQHLLYRCYVQEEGFVPAPGNPSDWCVTDDKLPRLTCKFDDVAMWVGAFSSSQKLVGVARMIPRVAKCDYLLEMEHYDESLRDHMMNAGLAAYKYTNLLECNRLAVNEEYRDDKGVIFWSLIMFGLEYSLKHEHSMVAATRVARLLVKLAGARRIGKVQYDATDRKATRSLVYFDESTLERSISMVKTNVIS
jgi:hypothetical protein